MPLSLTRVDGEVSNGRRIFSVETARAVRAMLESVTQTGGTATKAQGAGYRVGGTTGTALMIETETVVSVISAAPSAIFFTRSLSSSIPARSRARMA